MKATDLLKKGEVAIVLRTDGRHFHIDSKGFGHTGNWVINPSRQVHKVVIYKQDNPLTPNEIYVADHVGVSQHDDGRRYIISLADIRPLGSITEDWYEFADVDPGARNPVRYLKR
jgi:hypothetical protein